MPRKVVKRKPAIKKVKIDSIKLYDNQSVLNTYCFPESGIVVQATNLQEAYIKLEKELNK